MRSTDRAFTEIERASIERRFLPQQHSPSTSSLVSRRTAVEEDGTAGSPAAVTLDGPGTGDRGSDSGDPGVAGPGSGTYAAPRWYGWMGTNGAGYTHHFK